MRIIQHSKQLLLHLRLFVLLLLCYKNTSMHSPVQKVGARRPIGWSRMAVVAVLGNPGSGKASDRPGVQLFSGTYR